MVWRGSMADTPRSPQTEQIALAHETQDVLVIDLQAMDAPEFPADPPIAMEAMFERDRLNFVAETRFRPLRRAKLAKTIEAGARHAAKLAQCSIEGLPCVSRAHFFKDRVHGVVRDDRSRVDEPQGFAKKNQCPSAAYRSCARAQKFALAPAPVRLAEQA